MEIQVYTKDRTKRLAHAKSQYKSKAFYIEVSQGKDTAFLTLGVKDGEIVITGGNLSTSIA